MIGENKVGTKQIVQMMTRYMAWANSVMLKSVERIPDEEKLKPRKALFGSIVHTLNHILVIEDVFKAHLEGRKHEYTSRNTDISPPFEEVKNTLQELDQYYVDLANTLSSEELNDTIEFEFIGGGDGSMTRAEILLHLANHSTYHRGFVSDMLFQASYPCDSNDLTIFLREV